MSESILKQKSYLLAKRIVQLYKYICNTEKEYVLSKQVLRSGTSVGALIREAQNSVSTADFIHKLSIAQKECDETLYWLELLRDSDYIMQEEFESLYNDTSEILKMLRSAIVTSKSKTR